MKGVSLPPLLGPRGPCAWDGRELGFGGALGLPPSSLAAAPSSLGLGEGLISSHLPLYKEEAP